MQKWSQVIRYTCGKFTPKPTGNQYLTFTRRHIMLTFKLGDQDKSWAPHNVCKTCVEHVQPWTSGTWKSLRFGIPMIHSDECYICPVSVVGLSQKKHRSIDYPSLHSTIWPLLHSDDLPIPVFHENLLKLVESDKSDTNVNERHCENNPMFLKLWHSCLTKINWMTWFETNLSKESTELWPLCSTKNTS